MVKEVVSRGSWWCYTRRMDDVGDQEDFINSPENDSFSDDQLTTATTRHGIGTCGAIQTRFPME